MDTHDKKKLEILGKMIHYGCRICVYNIDFEVLEVDDDYARMLRIPVEDKDCLLGKTMGSASILRTYQGSPRKYTDLRRRQINMNANTG